MSEKLWMMDRNCAADEHGDGGCQTEQDHRERVLIDRVYELEAELARWKAAWPDPDEYAAALRREQGTWE